MLLIVAVLASIVAPAPASAQSVTVTRAPTDEEFVGPLPSWRNLKTYYGAVGDGVADDTAALQTAFNELRVSRNAGWSTLYIPAGTYRLTATITALRVDTNADFQGTQIIGADPATTILRYDGPQGGAMVTFDGWYSKMSRLTFDGNNKRAGTGLNRDGAFSTYCEISDVYFKDLASGIVFTAGTEYGQAETLVIRCQFDRVGTGIATGNFNSLDIWCWYNIFRDCTNGIFNYAGNYHAVGNLFLRSTDSDLGANNAFNFAFIDNVSIGSRTFANVQFGNVLLQRNRVYAPAGSAVINGATWTLLLDNVINSSAYPNSAPVSATGQTLAVGNTYTTTYGLRAWDPYGNTASAAPARAFDNNTATFSERGSFNYQEVHIDYAYANRATNTVTSYALTSVGGAPSSVPVAFALQGSNNQGRTWTTLDTRSGISWTNTAERKTFAVASPGAYEAYRVRFDSTGGGALKVAEIELLNASGADTTDDGLGLASSPGAGINTRSLDETLVAASTLPTPTSVAMPLAPINYNRTIFTVARGTGDDAQAIQNAINSAAASARAVVHLGAGAYSIARTITVPANKDIQIIGDGTARQGSRLEFSGAADTPVLRLEGPSRATLRDFYVQGGSPLLITNANQVGGRVYTEQLVAAGQSRPSGAAKSFFFNGVEDTDLTFVASQSGNTYGAVVDSGGPKLAAGQTAAGQHSLVTGTYEGLQTHAEVLRNARLTTLALYSEGARRHMYDLTGEGVLNSIANVDHSVADERIPTFSLDGFKGRFLYLLNLQDKFSVAAPTSWFDLRGDGSAMNVLIGLNEFGVTTGVDVVRDGTSPAADFSLYLNNDGGAYTRRQAGLEPTDAFIRDQLALLRDMRLELPTARATGVTDVKIFRVTLQAARGGTGFEVRAAADPAAVVPTAAPVLTATPAAPNAIDFTWTPVAGATHYSLERTAPGETGFSEVKLFSAARTAYRDPNLEGRSNYTYRLRGWNSAGASPYSASLARSTPRVYAQGNRVNVGGPAVGTFGRDSGSSGITDGDGPIVVSTAIDRSGVTDPAPEQVYQSGVWSRSDDFSYSFAGFVPGAGVIVRLHFAETQFTAVGARIGNVLINENPALTNFDIVAAAGGANRAVVREVTAAADSEGYVTVRFRAVNYSPLISGIEVARTPGPNPPTALQTRATPNVVRLDWTDNAGDETGFKIERKTGLAGTYAVIGAAAANATSYQDRTVVADATYYYRIRATNTDADSNPCTEVAALTRVPGSAAATFRLFDGIVPPSGSENLTDGGTAYELGTEFRSNAPGTLTHIRYYRAASDTGTHTGRIWSASGTQLASVVFTGETASGWQQQALATPLTISADTSYTVSVNVNSHYASANNGLATSVTSGPLSTVANGTNGRFGNPGAFPVNSYQSSNYFRDVVFTVAAPATPTGVAVLRTSPTQATLTWTDVATTEDGYLIERSLDGGVTWQGADLAAVNATSRALTDLASGQAHRFRLNATSSGGASVGVTVDLAASALTALQTWRQTNFGTTANTGTAADLADPDGDGVANLLEYALGGNPLQNSPGILPVAATNGSGALTLTFFRTRADVTYVVQGSSDLATWADLATNPGTVSTTTPVVFTDSVTAAARRFLRLKVTAP